MILQRGFHFGVGRLVCTGLWAGLAEARQIGWVLGNLKRIRKKIKKKEKGFGNTPVLCICSADFSVTFLRIYVNPNRRSRLCAELNVI